MPRARERVPTNRVQHVQRQGCPGTLKEEQGDQRGQNKTSEKSEAGSEVYLRVATLPDSPTQPTSLTTLREKRDWKAELEATASTSTKGCSHSVALLVWSVTTGVVPSLTLSTMGMGLGNWRATWGSGEGERKEGTWRQSLDGLCLYLSFLCC